MSSRSGRAQSMAVNTITAGQTVKVLDVDKDRDYMMIQNIGSENVKIVFNQTDTNGLLLKVDSVYEPSFAPRNEMYIINESATDVDVVVVEG